MNTKLAIPFLAALMAVQGCVIVDPDNRSPGNVTFSWTFLGEADCSVAGVANVRITIPGETLENGGVYPCTSNGYSGIVLHDFYGGSYTYNIEGFDVGGYTTYLGSGAFTIDGDVLETVDLTPYGQPTSYALVTWTFPGGVTCANADTPARQLGGVTDVDISFDGEQAVRAKCVDGAIANGGLGVYSAPVSPGAHTMTLTALATDPVDSRLKHPLFSSSSSMTTFANSPVSNEVALQWAVGGVVVKWSLQSSTGTAQACADVSNPSVYVNFVNTDYPYGIYPDPGDIQPCGETLQRYFYLPASGIGHDYRVDLTAKVGTATWTATTNPVVRVVPGVFPADTAANSFVLKQN